MCAELLPASCAEHCGRYVKDGLAAALSVLAHTVGRHGGIRPTTTVTLVNSGSESMVQAVFNDMAGFFIPAGFAAANDKAAVRIYRP